MRRQEAPSSRRIQKTLTAVEDEDDNVPLARRIRKKRISVDDDVDADVDGDDDAVVVDDDDDVPLANRFREKQRAPCKNVHVNVMLPDGGGVSITVEYAGKKVAKDVVPVAANVVPKLVPEIKRALVLMPDVPAAPQKHEKRDKVLMGYKFIDSHLKLVPFFGTRINMDLKEEEEFNLAKGTLVQAYQDDKYITKMVVSWKYRVVDRAAMFFVRIPCGVWFSLENPCDSYKEFLEFVEIKLVGNALRIIEKGPTEAEGRCGPQLRSLIGKNDKKEKSQPIKRRLVIADDDD